jgi:hypothetical protein
MSADSQLRSLSVQARIHARPAYFCMSADSQLRSLSVQARIHARPAYNVTEKKEKMPQYITRIELHDADWKDYTQLHEAMRREGFRQSITSGDGAVYELPPAEYNYVGQETRSQVHDKAKRAARSVKPSFAVLVTEATGVTWSGLKLLKAAAA